MLSILEALAADPNIDPRLREIFSRGCRKTNGVGVVGSERWREVNQEELADQQRDARRTTGEDE